MKEAVGVTVKIIDRIDFESPHYPTRSIGIIVTDENYSDKKFVLIASDSTTNMDVVIPLTMIDLNSIIKRFNRAKDICPDQTDCNRDDTSVGNRNDETCVITRDMFDD